jgi:UDP-N-acetyl-D-glucosamine dehydrogenase
LKNVCVVGLGYVGFPLALAAANANFFVTGIDSNSDLIKNLSASKINNPDLQYLQSQLDLTIRNNSFSLANSFDLVSSAQIVVVCLPTPLNDQGKPDLSILISGLKSIAEFISDEALIIVESTVFPGTMESIVKPIFKQKNVELGYSPERIDPSNKSFNLENTTKLISAFSDGALYKMQNFYSAFVKDLYAVDSVETAEFSKVIENTYRLVNISLVNELLIIGNELGLDTRAALNAANTKPFGFQLFNPSAGAGGHCIPVDPVYLLWKAQTAGVENINLISAAVETNNSMPSYVSQSAERLLTAKPSKILIYGISYKSGVSDTRNSSGLEIREHLIKSGHFVFWYDSIITELGDEKRFEGELDFDLIIIVNFDDSIYLKELLDKDVSVLDCTGKLGKSKNIFCL